MNSFPNRWNVSRCKTIVSFAGVAARFLAVGRPGPSTRGAGFFLFVDGSMSIYYADDNDGNGTFTGNWGLYTAASSVYWQSTTHDTNDSTAIGILKIPSLPAGTYRFSWSWSGYSGRSAHVVRSCSTPRARSLPRSRNPSRPSRPASPINLGRGPTLTRRFRGLVVTAGSGSTGRLTGRSRRTVSGPSTSPLR